MATKLDDPGLAPYDDEQEVEWDPMGLEAPRPDRGAGPGRRRRLGRTVTPRLVLGMLLLVLLAVVVCWGVQRILLPPVAAPTPTAMVVFSSAVAFPG